MFNAAAFAAATVLMTGTPGGQDPVPAPAPQEQDAQNPLTLEDVVVEGRTLNEATREFVGEVAQPVRRRGLARWHEGVCVGVVNMDAEVAQYLVDRISDIARELGLTAGAPGCSPSIIVVATDDGRAFSREFVAKEPRLFRPGGSGMDQGGAAMRAFLETDRAIRWWNVTLPVDADTGLSASRIPGQVNNGGGSVMDYAPVTALRTSSRLNSQYRQDMKRTFVIVDMNKLQGVSATQLADYAAMVSLAQVDPDADVSRFDSILNLFDGSGASAGLTGWDRAYLGGLYEAEWYRISQNSQVNSITTAINRAYRNGELDDEAAPQDAADQ